MHRFEDGGAITDVGARRHTEAADQTGTQIRQDVAEQVGGDHDVEALRVHHQVHAGGIDDHLFALDVRVAVGHLTGHFQEQTGGGLEDVGLVDDGDLSAPFLTGQLEGELDDALGPFAGDDAHRLRTLVVIAALLTGTRVHPFSVFTHRDDVDVVVTAAGALEGEHGTHVGVEVELLAQGDVDGGETATDRGGERPFQGDLVLLNQVECGLGQQLAVFLQRHQTGVRVFVFEVTTGVGQDLDGGFDDAGADAVARDDGNFSF